ncbi:MAG TPA: MerR family transcriptional regulator [Vulgatibacter sp.]
MASLLSDEELAAIEDEHRATGVSAGQVISLFQRRGVRLSEGTFRKYVQAGLLPRSRRVGRKGKNQGSWGVYPANVIRRVNAIKAMMSEGMTLEDIRGSFLFLRGELDVAEEALGAVGEELARALASPRVPEAHRAKLGVELQDAEDAKVRLTAKLERLASRIVAARDTGREPDLNGVGS